MLLSKSHNFAMLKFSPYQLNNVSFISKIKLSKKYVSEDEFDFKI